MIVHAPMNEIELRNILYTAQLGLNNPIAIRYPRGRGVVVDWKKPFQKIDIGKAFQLKKGSKIALLSTGTIGNNVIKALSEIENSNLFSHYHFPFVKPLDKNLLHEICLNYQQIITFENGVISGGFGSLVDSFTSEDNYSIPIKKIGVPDYFIEHGTVNELQTECGFNVETLKSYFETFS